MKYFVNFATYRNGNCGSSNIRVCSVSIISFSEGRRHHLEDVWCILSSQSGAGWCLVLGVHKRVGRHGSESWRAYNINRLLAVITIVHTILQMFIRWECNQGQTTLDNVLAGDLPLIYWCALTDLHTEASLQAAWKARL